MGGVTSNFSFLEGTEPRLARLGALAERYFSDDAPASLFKLRQLAELLTKGIAARHALLPDTAVTFDDVLRRLKVRGVLPGQVADLLYHLKRVGNAAAHEDAGTPADALSALKIARAAAVWFHQSYGGASEFRPGPFVPPGLPPDAASSLRQEIDRLRDIVSASADGEAKALLRAREADDALQDAVSRAADQEQQRHFWEQYAAETEAGLKQAEAKLKAAQVAATETPPQQLDLLALLASSKAAHVELDEATTRVIIDEQLRSAGWKADTALVRHSAGARPGPAEAIAIAEWPTASGPVDYALFLDGKCVGVIEAKREVRDVPGRLGQAKRYAKDIVLTPDETLLAAPWLNGLDAFQVPFLFVTNGRPFVKQLATKSGIWFWDARPTGGDPRALPEWFSPRDLKERLQRAPDDLREIAERELGVTGLRPYQIEAISAVEHAIAAGQQNMLLAMATGTGKTRLAIALMFELLRRKRFRRILFLVDRNALPPAPPIREANSISDSMTFGTAPRRSATTAQAAAACFVSQTYRADAYLSTTLSQPTSRPPKSESCRCESLPMPCAHAVSPRNDAQAALPIRRQRP